MTKTLHRRLYDALPIPVYRQACKYISPTFIGARSAYELRTGNFATAESLLRGAFIWSNTKEGVAYWAAVVARMK